MGGREAGSLWLLLMVKAPTGVSSPMSLDCVCLMWSSFQGAPPLVREALGQQVGGVAGLVRPHRPVWPSEPRELGVTAVSRARGGTRRRGAGK